MKKIILGIFLFGALSVFFGEGFAETTTVDGEGNTWTTYFPVDGITTNAKYTTKDTNENIWVGGNGGASEFDGSSWTTYTTTNGLGSNTVTSIHGDTQGNVWFGHWGSATKFDGTTWTAYSGGTMGANGNPIVAIKEDSQGNIWFAQVGTGLMKYDGASWTTHSDGTNCSAIDIDSQDNVWCTAGTEIKKYNGSSWTAYNVGDGLTGANFATIFVDSSDHVWTGSTNFAHLAYFDGTSWETYDPATDGIPDIQIRSIFEDKDQTLWIGGGGDSIYKFGDIGAVDPSQWTAYAVDTDSSWEFTQDATGDIWMSGGGGSSSAAVVRLQLVVTNIPDNFCSAGDISTLTNPLPDLIYWDLDGNNPYLANTGGTGVTAITAPAETVLTTAEITAIDGSAEPGMVYFDEETGELTIADSGGNLQDPATVTSNAVADASAEEAGSLAGEVYFDTTTGDLFYCEVDGTLDTPSDPSSSCLTQ